MALEKDWGMLKRVEAMTGLVTGPIWCAKVKKKKNGGISYLNFSCFPCKKKPEDQKDTFIGQSTR